MAHGRLKLGTFTIRPRQIFLAMFLTTLVIITLIPFYFTLLISQKTNGEVFLHFWDLPGELRPQYYMQAAGHLLPYMLNSIMVAVAVVCGVLLFSSLAAYSFSRIEFPAKNLFFTMIIMLMMIPGVLTLIPAFLWIKEIPFLGGNDWAGRGGSGLLNSRLALILPMVSGGQVMSIYLLRTFFESISESYFESARIEGSSELQNWWHIALPLSRPILATVAVLQFVGIYNDYIWPLLVIGDRSKQVFAVAVTQMGAAGELDWGPQMAGYVFGSIPLVIVFIFGMRHFVEGLTHGGLKG